MTFPLIRLSLSYFRRARWQAALALLGVAVGVATFVAIENAKQNVTSALSSVVVRLAGRADLQITGVGGVPELQESLRTIGGVDAVLPVIEQIVQPADNRLGGLLVIGVDLVGDHHIRDYGFERTDVDVDDPLTFLAQQDSIAVSREFAARAGLTEDAPFAIRQAGTTRTLIVRALLPPQEVTRAYGGNVAIMDVYAAQSLFGRGRRFDRLEVRVAPATTAGAVAAAISRDIGPSFRVTTPERRGRDLQKLANAALRGFEVLITLALGVSLFLVFNVFATSVVRRQYDIGILRAIGATPWQITLVFLIEAATLGAVGSGVGVLAGSLVATRVFGFVGAVLTATQGLAANAQAATNALLWPQGLAVGIAASLAGAWVPARRAVALVPVEAMAVGVDAVTVRPLPLWLAGWGVAALAAAGLPGHLGLGAWSLFAPTVTLMAAGAVIVVAGHSCRLLIAPTLRWLPRLWPASGRVAADALRRPQRTMATAATLTLCASFVLGTAGFLRAVTVSFDGWLARVMTADLVVRAASGFSPSEIKLPYEPVRAALLASDDVQAVDATREERVTYRGASTTLSSVDTAAYAARVRLEVIAGEGSRAVAAVGSEGQCLVSSAFADRFDLSPGDSVTLDSPTGPVALPIAAVIAGDRSMVLVDRALFVARWNDDRVDGFNIVIAPGRNVEALRQRVREALGPVAPALVITRDEFVAEVQRALSLVYIVIRATIVLMLIMAFVAIALSQIVMVTERRRDLGILRAMGAVPRQIGGALVLEALILAFASLAVAVPLGSILAWLLRTRASETIAGYHLRGVYPLDTLGLLVVGLPAIGLLATWVPAQVMSIERPVGAMRLG